MRTDRVLDLYGIYVLAAAYNHVLDAVGDEHRLYAPDYDGRGASTCYDDWRAAGLTEDDVRLSHATYAGEVTMVDPAWARPARGEARPPRDRRRHGARVRLGPWLLLRRAQEPWEVGLGCRAWHAELVAALPRDRRGPAVRSRARSRAAAHACAHDARRRAGNDSRPRRRRRAARARRVTRSRPSSVGRRTSIGSSWSSGWPLECQKGRITIAVDSWPRRIARRII